MATGFYNLSKKLKSWYKKCGPFLNPSKNVINVFPKKRKILQNLANFPPRKQGVCNRLFNFCEIL
jgi:hypothetical protein